LKTLQILSFYMKANVEKYFVQINLSWRKTMKVFRCNRPELSIIIFFIFSGYIQSQSLSELPQFSQKTAFDGQIEGFAPAPAEPLSLWYRRPAEKWTEALAIGNGRLGAMVFGGIVNERLQLNEDTLWAGGPYEPINPEALAALPEARRLIFEGQYRQASRFIDSKMMGKPLTQMPYQTVGDVLLQFDSFERVADYRRDLNLDTAVATTSFTADGVRYTRQVFSSSVDQVIAVHLTADKPGHISCRIGMKSPQKASVKCDGSDTLVLSGVNGGSAGIAGALKFQARLLAKTTGGTLSPEQDCLKIIGADSAVLLIVIATSYKKYNDVSCDPEFLTKQAIEAAGKRSVQDILKDHIAAHQSLFRRVSLDLGSTEAIKNPTDRRIADFAKGNDPQLAALYFQFGRYLLICSSRPGTQPANLQGIWNDSMTPPWGSKYTININTEMNYWPAEPTNLGECVEPLIAMVMDLSQTGRRIAQMHWGAGGWVCHHNTDLWRAAAPIDGATWGFWPTGGAWLCKHLWEHYEYNGDRIYLEKIWPVLKEAAQFFLDTLVEESTHKWLVTCPSLSPENGHQFGASICAGPTMDSQIIRDLFDSCIIAGGILNTDQSFRSQLVKVRDRLAPNQIGNAGQLQEWLEDWDMEAPDKHHRHVSHLYGLYPSDQINIYDTPELAAAARKSLEIRGDNATGWGIGWRLNLWARLLDAEHAYSILKLLIAPERTYPNMFDAHPPFQIDGNFGGTAGIAEMMMHSRVQYSGESMLTEIELLPALPKIWPNGRIQGLRAKGGFELDIEWREGRLNYAKIRSLLGNLCRVRYAGRCYPIQIQKGQEIVWQVPPIADGK